MKFSHRPTGLPGGNPETDRIVICDGYTIGRVMQVEPGHQQAGKWEWSCYWHSKTALHGLTDTLEEGLAAIKSRTPANVVELLPPGHQKPQV